MRIADKPELRIWRLSAITGISHSSVFRLLKKENSLSYQITSVENSLRTDLSSL